jgi:hypothetical protein
LGKGVVKEAKFGGIMGLFVMQSHPQANRILLEWTNDYASEWSVDYRKENFK